MKTLIAIRHKDGAKNVLQISGVDSYQEAHELVANTYGQGKLSCILTLVKSADSEVCDEKEAA